MSKLKKTNIDSFGFQPLLSPQLRIADSNVNNTKENFRVKGNEFITGILGNHAQKNENIKEQTNNIGSNGKMKKNFCQGYQSLLRKIEIQISSSNHDNNKKFDCQNPNRLEEKDILRLSSGLKSTSYEPKTNMNTLKSVGGYITKIIQKMNKKSLPSIVNKPETNENIKYTNRLFYHRFGAKKSPINSTTVSKKIQIVKIESNINPLNAPEKSHSV